MPYCFVMYDISAQFVYLVCQRRNICMLRIENGSSSRLDICLKECVFVFWQSFAFNRQSRRHKIHSELSDSIVNFVELHWPQTYDRYIWDGSFGDWVTQLAHWIPWDVRKGQLWSEILEIPWLHRQFERMLCGKVEICGSETVRSCWSCQIRVLDIVLLLEHRKSIGI